MERARSWRSLGAEECKGSKIYDRAHFCESSNENTKVVIFENSGKKDENGKVKNEKAPDFRVYLSEATKSPSSPKQEATKEADTASVPSTDEEVLF